MSLDVLGLLELAALLEDARSYNWRLDLEQGCQETQYGGDTELGRSLEGARR